MGKSKSYPFIYEYEDQPEIRKYIDEVSELFRLLMVRGGLALSDLTKLELVNEETNAILFLFRHAVALVDVIAKIAKLPSVEGIRIVARGFLEAKCSLEYILNENTEERAIAYQTHHIIMRILEYQKYDPSTDRGKQMQAKWEKDEFLQDSPFLGGDTTKEIDNLKNQLGREPFKSVWIKLCDGENLKKPTTWYNINNGPTDFEQLCAKLGYFLFYEFCYRPWSNVAHATGTYIDTFFKAEGEGKLHAIRVLKGYQDSISIILPMITDFYRKVFEKILPRHFKRFIIFYKYQYRKKAKEVTEGTKINIS